MIDYKQKLSLQCWKKRLDPTEMLKLLLALGGWNRWGGSAWCSPTMCLPLHSTRMHSHTHMQINSTSFPFISLYLFFLLFPILSLSSFRSLFLALPLLLFIISHLQLYFSRSLLISALPLSPLIFLSSLFSSFLLTSTPSARVPSSAALPNRHNTCVCVHRHKHTLSFISYFTVPFYA